MLIISVINVKRIRQEFVLPVSLNSRSSASLAFNQKALFQKIFYDKSLKLTLGTKVSG